MRKFILSAVLFLGCSLSVATAQASPIDPETKSQQAWWKNRYEDQVKALKEQPCDILFLGDSITDYWATTGKKVWDSAWVPLKALNFGISGDKTGNLIWRIDDSKLPTLSDPKVCVVMIGTNNTGHYKCGEAPEKTAIGVLTVVQRLLLRYPDTQVVLLAIFPRGATPQDPMRIHNDKINKILAATRLPRMHFVDINKKFLDPHGQFLPGVTRDQLHPTEKGYQIWASSLLPTVKKILTQQ
ncbi:GDSL-type esterase/lipase family protein [Akkermansia sp. N21169]|uniref:GDSL-type esterase/lipase family protein n=1 Tax=Akkermansia sp. N21169 TaxID=3040765 RepID=UPI00244E68F2|nr:GDSL-type esterase/lipase family protein [Akkermansia sp. N21169]MDH3068003.1 GDSL-type esterase/lipase family protein [Akkermansia sp. N21169]